MIGFKMMLGSSVALTLVFVSLCSSAVYSIDLNRLYEIQKPKRDCKRFELWLLLLSLLEFDLQFAFGSLNKIHCISFQELLNKYSGFPFPTYFVVHIWQR